ncbi:MAG: hotdog fold thioesterase [Caldilineaceae bacterium]|nr:hotdog fold thioesterase [Caldilineaceae bacterium]HRJ44958.1 hotdog fold thioesterase [Caldilineaceae bacterium]
MFTPDLSLEALNAFSTDTLVSHLGIEFMEIGADFIRARMPVDSRTVQPFRLLHGGASVALAESLGSVASFALVDPARQNAVGLEINANHLRAVRGGYVHATARPLHIGRRTHVWDIRIVDDEDRLVCVCRFTVAIVERE